VTRALTGAENHLMNNSETRHLCSILAIAVVMYACRTSWSVHLFSSLKGTVAAYLMLMVEICLGPGKIHRLHHVIWKYLCNH